jgi:hypothetical protein
MVSNEEGMKRESVKYPQRAGVPQGGRRRHNGLYVRIIVPGSKRATWPVQPIERGPRRPHLKAEAPSSIAPSLAQATPEDFS